MAAQLGIQKRPAHYWYCMFALRYPLAPEWEAVVREDTRWYLNLQQDTAQPVHPMVKKYREHLSDVIANEFLGESTRYSTKVNVYSLLLNMGHRHSGFSQLQNGGSFHI